MQARVPCKELFLTAYERHLEQTLRTPEHVASA